MPFINGYGSTSSSSRATSNGGGSSNGFDRFSSSRKSSVYDRPFMPKDSSVAALSSKYLSLAHNNGNNNTSDSYRSRNFGSKGYSGSNNHNNGNTTSLSESSTPFGVKTKSYTTPASNYSRTDGGTSYKPSSRSNSRSLFQNGEDTENIRYSTGSNGSSSSNGRSYNVSGSNGSGVSNDLSDRIAKTLAKHGVQDRIPTPNSFTDSPYNSLGRSGTWRKRFESVEPADEIVTKKTVVSRATSPQSDRDKMFRTRIARTTDEECLETRRSRKPRVYEVAIQTDVTPEFGELKTILKSKTKILSPPKSPSTKQKPITRTSSGFDYFARVKKSLEEAPNAFARVLEPKMTKEEPSEAAEDSYYKIEKAPMMQLLPGSRQSSVQPSTNRSSLYEPEVSPVKQEASEEEEEEEESEYEEYSEEEAYEDKADRALEEEADPKSPASPIKSPVLSPGVKRKGSTYIGGTVDIDVLLAKETDPTNLIDSEEEGPTYPSMLLSSLDFSGAKKISSIEPEGSPWWMDVKPQGEVKKEEESIEKTEEKEVVNEEEAEEVEEEDGDYEEEGEWEYYTEGDEGNEEDNEVKDKAPTPELTDMENEDRLNWILQGLCQLIPALPAKRGEAEMYSGSESSSEEDDDFIEEEGRSYDKGYSEWLQESAELHTDIQLQENGGGESSGSESEATSAHKAAKLVQKIKGADEVELKGLLFGLKSLFQSDKDLVYEFVQAGGLSTLVKLGDQGSSGESQIQNLILRALGQIMLYVDGMNGVMESGNVVEFLYKLTASSNPLVCKTGIKLLLVFVEYLETNCNILIQAVSEADKAKGITPWATLIKIINSENISDGGDLFKYAITLINKTLYGIATQSVFYDQIDFMEVAGIETGFEYMNNKLGSRDSSIMEQIQLFNVAIKQEDGEPVTEDEISFIGEEASELGLRSVLRIKSEPRKSLRYKSRKIAEDPLDSTGDMENVSFKDAESILKKHGLPTTRSAEALNFLELDSFLDKTRSIFTSKISKGEAEDTTKGSKDTDQLKEEDIDDDEAEGEKQWERIKSEFKRPLIICDLDFSDLQEDASPSAEVKPLPGSGWDSRSTSTPPPTKGDGVPPPPPPMPTGGIMIPPPPPPPLLKPPEEKEEEKKPPVPLPQKNKKTVKLFWREIRNNSDNSQNSSNGKKPSIWEEKISTDIIDCEMIEYLFEYRGKDVAAKENKPGLITASREIVVLDPKRSNSINIGMTKLPPPRIIRSAVIKMDSSIMNREGVDKLLTMLPTQDETERIQEAKEAQPDIPLGTAEQFLLTLSSISGLEARLRLWSFKMEFEVIEKELCDPIMDLKTGIESLMHNITFKTIVHILLYIGNFLNGTTCRGFHLDYLAKVPEVKDTVHKHSLLYHTTFWLLEVYPGASDLYSEMGPLIRASRTDFSESERTLRRIEEECKHAWDYLKTITKSAAPDSGESEQFSKFNDFLFDAAERILVMSTVHKKVIKKYHGFLSWLGVPGFQWSDYPVHSTCKTLSEFALEFRTTRDRVIQTIQKKKAAREKKLLTRKTPKNLESAEASNQGNAAVVVAAPSSLRPHRPRHRDAAQQEALEKILGKDIDVTDNGTLRRRKKHHRSRRTAEAVPGVEGEVKKEKKSRRHNHRPSFMGEGRLPLTEELIMSLNTNDDMERGLLETLIMAPDTSSLKRNKERRRSKMERKASTDLARSRTRELPKDIAVIDDSQT